MNHEFKQFEDRVTARANQFGQAVKQQFRRTPKLQADIPSETGRVTQAWNSGVERGVQLRRSLADKQAALFNKLSRPADAIRERLAKRRQELAPEVAVAAIMMATNETQTDTEAVHPATMPEKLESLSLQEVNQVLEEQQSSQDAGAGDPQTRRLIARQEELAYGRQS